MKISASFILIGATYWVFVLQGQSPARIDELFALWAGCNPSTAKVYFQPWQIISYAFLHGE